MSAICKHSAYRVRLRVRYVRQKMDGNNNNEREIK